MIQKKICMLGASAVGKTSLVSRFVRSIFSEKYHTTVGVKVDKKVVALGEDQMDLLLWDLYGEDEFQKMRTSYLRGSSGYMLVVDGTRHETLEKAVVLQNRTEETLAKVPFVLVLNKIDLVAKARLLPVIEQLRQWREFADIVPVSAVTGDGVDTLERLLLAKMPEGPALYPDDYLTDQPQRVLVSETVREKVLHHTHDELPFSTAVIVDQYDEPDRPGGLVKVYCTILVETESQKPIVIGRAGSMIKQIGTEARKELEASLDCKVYLDLRVKVKSDWRDDERVLDDLGLPRKR